MSTLKYAAAISFCILTQSAFAQSLAEKELYAKEESAMVSRVENTNKQCQTSVKFKFDWASFKKADLEDRGATTFCEGVFSAINDVCTGSDAGLKAVQSKIKSVTCKQAAPRTIALKNGELIYGIDYNAANDRDAVFDFLKKNL